MYIIMLYINVVKGNLFTKWYSDIIGIGSFLENQCMRQLSGARKLPGAVWAIPRQGIKLHRRYMRKLWFPCQGINDVMDAWNCCVDPLRGTGAPGIIFLLSLMPWRARGICSHSSPSNILFCRNLCGKWCSLAVTSWWCGLPFCAICPILKQSHPR